MPVNLVQYRETVGIFNNRNRYFQQFFKTAIKKIFEPRFFQTYFLSNTVIYPAISWCRFLCYWTALTYLKPKMHNVATISALALFFVKWIHLRTVNWLYSFFLILFSSDVEINPSPRHNSGESFSICHWRLDSVSAYNYTKVIFSKSVYSSS